MEQIKRKVDKEKEKQNEIKSKKIKLLKRDIAIATSTPEGKIFARLIMELCGFFKSDVTMNPKTMEINERSTLYNCMRSNIWLEIRAMIPVKNLKKIEYEKTKFNVEDL